MGKKSTTIDNTLRPETTVNTMLDEETVNTVGENNTDISADKKDPETSNILEPQKVPTTNTDVLLSVEISPKKDEKNKVKKSVVKAEKIKKTPFRERRISKTIFFDNATEASEWETLNKIYLLREENGLSNSWAHFIRQCIDYALNAQFEDKRVTIFFATGETSATFLKNGFFKPENNG